MEVLVISLKHIHKIVLKVNVLLLRKSFYYKNYPIINDSGGIATTSLDELPTPSSENVQLVTHDKPSEQENVVVKNETNTAEQIRERDNELITGIQKASANGMLELPSRDIPMDKMAVTADNQVKLIMYHHNLMIILQNMLLQRKLLAKCKKTTNKRCMG